MQIVDAVPPAPPTPRCSATLWCSNSPGAVHAAFSEYLRRCTRSSASSTESGTISVSGCSSSGRRTSALQRRVRGPGLPRRRVRRVRLRHLPGGMRTALPTVPRQPPLASETDEIRGIDLGPPVAAAGVRPRCGTASSVSCRDLVVRGPVVGGRGCRRPSAPAEACRRAGRRRRMARGRHRRLPRPSRSNFPASSRSSAPAIGSSSRPARLFGRGLYLDLPGARWSARPPPTASMPPGPNRAGGGPRCGHWPIRPAWRSSIRSDRAHDRRRHRHDFSLAQPTVSMHVKRLREAGLVNSVRRGNRLEITVNRPSSQRLAVELTSLLAV